VIGQEPVKKKAAVDVLYPHCSAIHMNRYAQQARCELQEIDNPVIVPPVRVRPWMAQTVARYWTFPPALCHSWTPPLLPKPGMWDEDVEEYHPEAASGRDGDVQKCQQGIIYIDEIDKSAAKDEKTLYHARRSGEVSRQALLKILEGTVATCRPRRTQAPAPGIYAGDYDEYPVHLRRALGSGEGDCRSTARRPWVPAGG